MKGGVRKKEYFFFLICSFITFPLIGWYLGGILAALAGLGIAFLMNIFFPTWKYELTWHDIDLALKNIYKYGSSPCELTFRVKRRRLFVYRDEKDDTYRGGPQKTYIRIAVRIPVNDWSDLLADNDFDKLFNLYGGMAMYSDTRGPRCYSIYMKAGRELENCKELLKVLFQKSVGGLRPDIYALRVVNAKKDIWTNHEG